MPALSPQETELRELIVRSGLFQSVWYLDTYPDVRSAGADALDHLVRFGAKEGRNPGPGFDAAFYAGQLPEGGDPGCSPLEHYLRQGQAAGLRALREPVPHAETFASLLAESGLFDAAWYLARNPDLRGAGVEPFEHLVRAGAKEWRDPGPNFEAAFYAERCPALPADGSLSPLEHYLRFGRAEGIPAKGPNAYARWVERFDTLTPQDCDAIAADASSLGDRDILYLHVAGGSDDRGDDIRPFIDGQIGARPVLRIIGGPGDVAGLAPILNDLPDGAVVILAGDRARLRPQASHAFAAMLDDGGAAAAYSDHDHVDQDGHRLNPVFKPAMSPALMRRTPYAGPVVAVRLTREIRDGLPRILGTALEAGAAAAWAPLLLELDRTEIRRIPLCLYAMPDASPADPASDGVTGERGPASPGDRDRASLPDVRILIPTRDRRELLEPCIASLLERTDYPEGRFRIVVIDNASSEPESVRYLSDLADHPLCSIVPSPGPFNFARICNDGAASAGGDVLVFLNNDMVVIEPDWLIALVTHAEEPDVGAVGARLLYPDETVQHGGIVLGVQGVGAHWLARHAASDVGGQDVTREMTAVTGACLAIRREVFDRVGGFDPILAVAYNDVDLCLRLHGAGFRNLYVARSLFYHHESKSRGLDDTPHKIAMNRREASFVRARHHALLQNDPAYNPNLSLQRIGELAPIPRYVRPWRRSRSRPRVLILTAHGRNPGVGDVIAQHVSEFLQRGWEVTVGGIVDTMDGAFPGCRLIPLSGDVQAAAYAVAEGYDCVVAHTAPFLSVTKYFGRRPLAYIFDHGTPPPASQANRVRPGADPGEGRLNAFHATRVFCVSQAVRDEQYRQDAVVIDGGTLDLPHWSAAWRQYRPALRRRFGFTGKFVVLNISLLWGNDPYDAGMDLFDDLVSEFKFLCPAAYERVLFVAVTPEAAGDASWNSQADVRSLANLSRREITELQTAGDLSVCLDRWAGSAVAVEQALALGLEVIASDSPVYRDFDIPRTGAVPRLVSLIGDAFARWDEGAPARAPSVTPRQGTIGRMIDAMTDDLDAAAAGPWLS